MSARRSSAGRWPVATVAGLYTGMVLVSVEAGAEGYWLGFANGAGLIAVLSVMASCSTCRPARYGRPSRPSTTAVRVPEQRTNDSERRPRGAAGLETATPEGSFQRPS